MYLFSTLISLYNDHHSLTNILVAEVGKLNKKERMSYDRALKARRDYNNTINYAKEEAMREGKAEGLAEGKAEGKAEEQSIPGKWD